MHECAPTSISFFFFSPWSKFKLWHSRSQFLWSCKYMIQLHGSSSYNKIKAIKIRTLIFLPSSPSLLATFKAFLRSIRFCIALSIIETRDRKLLLPNPSCHPIDLYCYCFYVHPDHNASYLESRIIEPELRAITDKTDWLWVGKRLSRW